MPAFVTQDGVELAYDKHGDKVSLGCW